MNDASAPRSQVTRITVTKNGPYAVTGVVPLSRQAIGANAQGDSADWVELERLSPPARYFLCRCGRSGAKPYCDGSHADIGFDGSETASRAPYADQAQVLDGPALTMTDAESLCAFARFCDRAGTVWKLVDEAKDGAARDALVAQIGQCPSGRLAVQDRATGAAIEPAFPASIVLIEDPHEGASGPIWVRGAIEVVGADGVAWERRNRVTLCRCGQSANKPFCDGSHATVHFRDESVGPSANEVVGLPPSA